MGNNQGQLKSSRFEAALHMSIEQSLRSNNATPQPVFSQLYLEKDVKPKVRELNVRPSNDGRQERDRASISPRAIQDVRTHPEHRSRSSEPSTPVSTSPRLPHPSQIRHPVPSKVHAPVVIPSHRIPPHPSVTHQPLPPAPLVMSRAGPPQIIPRHNPADHVPTPSSMAGMIPKQMSPRPPADELVQYRREYIDGSGMLYNSLTMHGCQEVGFCQAGADIRLTELTEKSIDLPKGFILVGTKSPYLPENIVVAAVDARFLPDPNTNLALLGFSGNCVGCGEKGFRYFTEFSHHINLKLTTQAKKQKHLKYYIVKNKQGQLVRGPNIPWKECRKRSYSSSGMGYISSSPNVTIGNQTSVIVSRSLASQSSAISYRSSHYPRSSPSTTINHYAIGLKCESNSPMGQLCQEKRGASPSETGSAQQPLKKRHRFHNMDGDRPHVIRPEPISPKHLASHSLHPPNFVPPPVTSSMQDTCFVPPGLAEACGGRVIILTCSGPTPLFHGNVMDIMLSPIFRDCLKTSQQIPHSVVESLGLIGMQNMNLETMVLVMVQYLVQLGEEAPSCEEFELALLRARQETVIKDLNNQHNMPQFTTVAPLQLPLLAKLAVTGSSGRVSVHVAQTGIADGLAETLKLLQKPSQTAQRPLYTLIIHVSRMRGTEFCIVVSGSKQTRSLTEARLTVAETFKEISYEIITGKIQLLTNHFKKNNIASEDLDVLLEKFSARQDKVLLPFNGDKLCRIDPSSVTTMKSSISKDCVQETELLTPVQIAVAMRILSQVCAIADSDHLALDLGRFTQVELHVILPASNVLYHQVIRNLVQSNLLSDLELANDVTAKVAEKFVIKCDATAGMKERFETLLKNVKESPYTLFVVVHEQAHQYTHRAQHGSNTTGSNSFLHRKEMMDAQNVLMLLVSHTPYNLQTQRSLISPQNEICMPTSMVQPGVEPEQIYFGLEQLKATLEWSNETPHLQTDECFETIATELCRRYPKLHSSVVRTYLLVRQYSAALMSLSGIPSLSTCSTATTLKMVQDVVTEPMSSTCGLGPSIILRVQSPQLAILAHDKLRTVRDKMGLQFRLDILLCSGDQEVILDNYFLKHLQAVRGGGSSWKPQTYSDLDGLPCIMVVSGKHTSGEKYPRSTRYVDLRLVNHGQLNLASLEEEMGLANRYISPDLLKEVITAAEDSDDEDEEDDDDNEGTIDYDIATPPSIPIEAAQDDISVSVEGSNQIKPADTTVRTPGKVPHNDIPHSTTVHQAPSPGRCKSPLSSTQEIESSDGSSMVTNCVSSASSPVPHFKSKSEPDESREVGRESNQEEEGGVEEKKPDKLPTVIVSKTVYNKLVKAEGIPSISTILPSADTSWTNSVRPPLVTDTPEAKSAHFRMWTEPNPHYYDLVEPKSATKFHPRRLLLYGPPQVGKTGVYIHFARVLSRMLVRLQEVEVLDQEEINESAGQTTTFDPVSTRWPEFEKLSQMPFDRDLHAGHLKYHSPLWKRNVQFVDGDAFNKEVNTTCTMLTKYSAHNAFHRCEKCQQHIDVSASEVRDTKSHVFNFKSSAFTDDFEMQFIIPPQQVKHFIFNEQTRRLQSMRLPTVNDKGGNIIKTPIFTPTFGRPEQAMVNLVHAMDDASYLQVLVCKQKDVMLYEKQWPNRIILVLPAFANETGPGAAKFFIKELAFYNLQLEVSRQEALGVRRQDVWPFIIIMEDTCVTWHAHNLFESQEETLTSLRSVLQHIEATPKIQSYGMLGVREWNSRWSREPPHEPFSNRHLHNMVFINVDLTQGLQYDQNRYYDHDIDFSMQVGSVGLTTCCFNHIGVLIKHLPGPHEENAMPKPKLSALPHNYKLARPISVNNFVCTPDSEELIPLVMRPQLLLERFLKEASAEMLFLLSVKNPENPVLCVDCYHNLGLSIAVHYVSSRNPSSVEASKGIEYSGLVLYMCSSYVTADFLKQFKFINGAKLCLISLDRNTLRRLVVRLDLEDQWQFRLRDEFQTANAREDRPIFLLTGIHAD
ncbi:GREB1-like protein [Anneissia japonica]|uniref:GREB1-like protein n=1 Tax=Anneissia japonica TaxID=1529436 RepID=UPI001425B876|nr:GREB1-like protein [Anneissia japonica]XP_033120965.1 GREB1-like protein [Anneissia japonica]XP_033120966.1 GREB1-like protein [Anneissia japonica]